MAGHSITVWPTNTRYRSRRPLSTIGRTEASVFAWAPTVRWHGAQRVQERDKPDESSNTVTAQTSLKLKHRAQQACRMIHTIRAQHFQLQQQHNMSREAKRRNDRQAEAERAVHQSHGCSFERFSLR